MLPPTRAGGSCGTPYARILSMTRRQADKYSQSAGGRFTASIRLAEIGLIGEFDAILERCARPPAEFCQPADVEQLVRRAVRPRGVETDLAGVADGGGDDA